MIYFSHVNLGEELYHVTEQRATSSQIGTEKPYPKKYAFDYREAIDKQKREEMEKEVS